MLPFLSHETRAKLCDSTAVMLAAMISSCCYSAANRISAFSHAKISSRKQINTIGLDIKFATLFTM
jgi:hypothetical protein